MSGRLRLKGLLRHPTEPRLLLLRSDRTWRLPRVAVRGAAWTADARTIVPVWERRLGTTLWLLRTVSSAYDEERDVRDAVQELEPVDTGWRPPANSRWAASDDVEGLRMDADDRALSTAFLHGLERVPPPRPPWSRHGWPSELRAWLDVELARAGRRLVALEQVKVWGISTVLRVETDRGDLYFKASAALPLFVNEAVVTQRLSRRLRGSVLSPVAVEASRGWMLTEPFEVVGWDAPLDVRCEIFRRFAGLQVRTVELTGELLAGGCLDRRLDVLERQLGELIGDRRALHRLTAAEVRALRRLAPRLRELCLQLADLGLPATLVHGDLHPGNVAKTDGGLAYFDWTDACVAHPFVDLHSLRWERDEASRGALLDAYLEPWRTVAPDETLRDAVALARVATPLHHAVSYATIAAAIEPASSPELDATHDFLREAMARAREV